jgi:crotonobetainyl-CoA:carnitine CoA-transferase CaiB-like acyl-CoA transferase
MKVIEIASVLAGPAVGMFFAELGAEVIKIENKTTGGDVTRTWKLSSEEDSNISAYYASVNWNKKTYFLDFKNSEDLEFLYSLAKDADIIIANYKQSSALKLGIDYHSFKSINPKIIYGNIIGFSDEDERVAFDLILQAESGFMYMNGQPNDPPTKMPVAMIDIMAAHHLKEGILYALWKREIKGEGAYVSVSLLDSAIASLANQATNWLMAGHIPQRIGSLHPNIAPYGEIFTSCDRIQFVVAIGNDKQFYNFCKILDTEFLVIDSKYADNLNRVKNRIELYSILQLSFSKMDSNDLYNKCIEMSVPIGRIKNMKELFDSQHAQNLLLTEVIDNQITKRVKTKIFKIKN